jgi:hypothetical protein
VCFRSGAKETDAASGQESGKRGSEIEVPLGSDLRFLGDGVDQPLRWVGDRPRGGRQTVRRQKRTFTAPERPSAGNACSIAFASDITAVALVRLISTSLSRSTSRSRCRWRLASMVAEERVGGQTVGECLGDP